MAVGKKAASPLRRLRAGELAEVFEHGETLRLQFPKEDLGYIYSSGAGEPPLRRPLLHAGGRRLLCLPALLSCTD